MNQIIEKLEAMQCAMEQMEALANMTASFAKPVEGMTFGKNAPLFAIMLSNMVEDTKRKLSEIVDAAYDLQKEHA